MKSLIESYGGALLGAVGAAGIIGLIILFKPELIRFLQDWCSRFL
ncbi:MAG: hypothetical protein PUG16_07555 [Lachnospiraceae bacterium]|jgi:hypothetical protein|nr:hypothetical protein [Lachnospiraceae bacterium]